MPNSPAIPDMGLRATTSDLMTTVLSGAPIPSAPSQPVEQTFSNILTSMMENKLTTKEDDTENMWLALPVDAFIPGMMPVPVSQWINQPQPALDTQTAELLSMLPTSITSSVGRYPADLLRTTNPIELTDITKGISNTTPIPIHDFDQAINAENFADSGKILPTSMTDMASNTGQPVTSEPDILTRGNPLSTEPENRISNGQHLASSLQTINQVNTTTPPIELSDGNRSISNTTPIPIHDFDQAINAENFADSGKILPTSMTYMISNTGQLVTSEPDILARGNPLSTEPENRISNGQHLASSLQTIHQVNTTTPPIELSDGNRSISNTTPIPIHDFDQAINAENFADSGKILPTSMTDMASNTGQPVTSEPDILTRGNPLSTEPENRISNGQHLASSLQTINQVNTTTPPIELSDGNRSISNTTSIPVHDFNQAIDAASGKTLSTSMTSIAMHTNITPLTDTADTTMNSAPAIAAEFGHPDWPEEFGQKITWLATQRMQVAELKLHPAHLGPIEISLQLSDDHQLTAQFVSHHTAVREAIEANLPRLREIMAENGITLADTSVSADTPQQQAESERGNSSRSSGNNRFPNNSIGTHTPASLITRHSGTIDTFA